MPSIISVGTAVPEHIIGQDEVRQRARRHFAGALADIDRLVSLFTQTGIEKRHVCMPVDWYEAPHSFARRNALYQEHATQLGLQAAQRCLAQADSKPGDVDAIFFISSTGLATPSLEARLAQQLGLRRDVVRSPLWGLGCAGGAAGLARAYQYLRGHPQGRALVVAVELCSLTFHPQDLSKRNLVAAALFADGAAAALLTGDELDVQGQPSGAPAIVASTSHLWENTEGLMGWEVTNRGLEVVFSRRIPAFARRELAGAAESLLEPTSLTLADLDHFVLHPGGTRVLEAYSQAWGLSHEDLEPARSVMAQYGNMSSPTVLFVLHEVISAGPEPGSCGILTALGPGFTSEQVLLQW